MKKPAAKKSGNTMAVERYVDTFQKFFKDFPDPFISHDPAILALLKKNGGGFAPRGDGK